MFVAIAIALGGVNLAFYPQWNQTYNCFLLTSVCDCFSATSLGASSCELLLKGRYINPRFDWLIDRYFSFTDFSSNNPTDVRSYDSLETTRLTSGTASAV